MHIQPDDPRSDQQLISALNSGDARAFDAIYFRYRDWVIRLAARFTGNNDDALDVLQETFAYLFRKFPGFTLTASMATFLYPVVKNLSAAARHKRQKMVSDDVALGSVEQRSTSHSQPDDLAALLASLPEGQREVLLLRFVDGLSLEEIAAVLEIPLGTVKSRIHNALATLRADERARKYFLE